MITIVDYDTGNLRSIENALDRIGCTYRLSSDPREIAEAEKVLLPGVGEASTAMRKLSERGLIETIRNLEQPTLGICLGMQLLCSHSEEGDVETLGIFSNKVKKLTGKVKIPHVGWNTIYNLRSPLMRDVKESSFVYYVHSYYAEVNENTIATTSYSNLISGSLQRDNFYGCQFHPEKSGSIGEQILLNFSEL